MNETALTLVQTAQGLPYYKTHFGNLITRVHHFSGYFLKTLDMRVKLVMVACEQWALY